MARSARPGRAARAARVRAARPARRSSWRPPRTSRSPRWCQPDPALVAIISLSLGSGPLPLGVFLECAFVGRVHAQDAAAGADFGHDEFLALLLLEAGFDDDFGDGARNHQNAFAIAD